MNHVTISEYRAPYAETIVVYKLIDDGADLKTEEAFFYPVKYIKKTREVFNMLATVRECRKKYYCCRWNSSPPHKHEKCLEYIQFLSKELGVKADENTIIVGYNDPL